MICKTNALKMINLYLKYFTFFPLQKKQSQKSWNALKKNHSNAEHNRYGKICSIVSCDSDWRCNVRKQKEPSTHGSRGSVYGDYICLRWLLMSAINCVYAVLSIE